MKRDTILILSNNYKLTANKQLVAEIKKAGYIPGILNPSNLQPYLSDRNKWDLLYDTFRNKAERIYSGNIKAIIPRIGKNLAYSCFVVEQLNQNQGIYTCQTAEAIKTASNKMKTLQKCSSAGLHIPKTIFVNGNFDIDFIISKLGLPFICKTTTGSQGAGVSVLDTKRTAVSVLDTLLKGKQSLLLQEFIGNGTDIRAIVVGNKVVASQIRKTTDKDEFRANLSLGGLGKSTLLDKETQKFCIEASKSVGLDVSGVDIMFDKGGKPTLIEVNSNFGWKIQKITGVNIAKHIVEYVIAQSEIKQKYINKQNIYDIFGQSNYLHDSFKKLKGKNLKYTDRQGNQKTSKITEITDLYKIIETTLKFA